MPKILFIAAHRLNRSPSQRFRFEQYFSFLKQNGFDHDFSYLISEKDDKFFYRHGNLHRKLYVFIKAVWKRWKDVMQAKSYDIIFVQREAFMTGSTFFEKKFKKSGAKLVFDFDDSIWHLDTSEANKKFDWLKNPAKTAAIIAMSDLVFAGNHYLANYAKHHNEHVVIIPTTIDTHEYNKRSFPKVDNRICIGWSGSITTIRHFDHALPVLKNLKKKFGEKIYFKVIGDDTYKNEELGIKGIAWNLKSEIEDLSEFDIGIMPLPDDDWSRGKCGLKGLQYMALEIPCVMSSVGVNSEIVSDGINGFLANNEDDWNEKISALIVDRELRTRIGVQARRTIEEKYSVNSQKDKYLTYLKNLLG